MKTFFHALLISVLFVAVPYGFTQQTEAQLIDVLNSAAPQQQKADACIELSKIGSRNAVAPLAALLENAELSHMAVYAPSSRTRIQPPARHCARRLVTLPVVLG